MIVIINPKNWSLYNFYIIALASLVAFMHLLLATYHWKIAAIILFAHISLDRALKVFEIDHLF